MEQSKKLSKIILKEKIDSLNGYFKKYPHDKRVKDIETIKQHLDNQEYKIAVVANMSSGKSTFINALFGEEVLPAFNHATTDCATFIYSKPNIDKKAIVYFSDKKKPVEIIDNIEDEIKQYAQKDAECEHKKHKNVEKIELYYPFKNLQTSSSEDFSITFIDTPGPNSTGDFSEKHKSQTRNVLNDVDLALYMFNYEQLDSILEDKQGLWNTIETRHKKDKNFDVYFLLNKIDMAIEKDNFQEIGKKEGEEYKKYKLENWFKHESKAINKLINAGKKHGIKEPRIYPIASELQLFHRDKNIGYDSEDKLELFQKQNFKRVFDSSWEEKFIEYIGISKLEKDINSYINSSVKDKILIKINSQLNCIYDDENKDLELRLQTLQKPQQEAEENLKKAETFLQVRAVEMQKEMKKESSQLEEKYIKIMKTIVDNAIEDELLSKINEIVKETIAFTQAYAFQGKFNIAKKNAKKNANNITLDATSLSIEIDKKIDRKDVMLRMQDFIRTIFEDYKRNYLDLKSDIKEEYFNFERESNKSFSNYKIELEQELESALDVKMENLETQSIDYEAMLTIDIKVPNSVLDYSFQKANYKTVSTSNWWNPFSWGGTKRLKTRDEKHTFIITPKDLKKSLESSMEESISKFSDHEKDIHKITIKKHLDNNSNMFQEFRHERQVEMDKLQKEIISREDSLEQIKIQYREFQNIQKD